MMTVGDLFAFVCLFVCLYIYLLCNSRHSSYNNCINSTIKIMGIVNKLHEHLAELSSNAHIPQYVLA